MDDSTRERHPRGVRGAGRRRDPRHDKAARFSWSHGRPIEIADFVAQVLTAAAANIGTTSKLLAGRPGSWKADLVRQLIGGSRRTDGDYLPEHPTDPIVVDVDVDETWRRRESRRSATRPRSRQGSR